MNVIAGTDDGHVHQCSISSADSYVKTYRSACELLCVDAYRQCRQLQTLPVSMQSICAHMQGPLWGCVCTAGQPCPGGRLPVSFR